MMNIIRSVNHAAQWFAVRLYTRGSSRADRQRGASALEYIVLAAAIIIIIGVLATSQTVQTALTGAFSSLFNTAKDVADGAGTTTP